MLSLPGRDGSPSRGALPVGLCPCATPAHLEETGGCPTGPLPAVWTTHLRCTSSSSTCWRARSSASSAFTLWVSSWEAASCATNSCRTTWARLARSLHIWVFICRAGEAVSRKAGWRPLPMQKEPRETHSPQVF